MKRGKWLLLIPALWLIWHLTIWGINGVAGQAIEAEYSKYRVYFFAGYAAILIICGGTLAIGKLVGKLSVRRWIIKEMMPVVVLGLAGVEGSLIMTKFLAGLFMAMR